MRLRQAVLAGESGVGLIGVMGLAAAMSIVIAALTLYVDAMRKERLLGAARAERDRVAERVHLQVISPDALNLSGAAAGNQALGRCVPDGLPGMCQATSAATEAAFDLYVPHSAASAGIRVAGTPANPVRYNVRGERAACAPGPKCPFEAVTYFWATCENFAPQCPSSQVKSLHVRRQMRMAAGIRLDSGVRLESVPKDRQIAADPMKLSTEVAASLLRARSIQCNPYSYMVGMRTDANGAARIDCKCLPNMIQSGTDPVLGLPICTGGGRTCPAGFVFLGLKPDLSTNCVKLPPASYACQSYQVNRSGQANCPSGWKMRALQTFADCRVRSDIVNCPDMWMTCCTLR